MVVAGFQTWTGWWFSWNDIVGLFIPNIFLSWQHSSVIYLNFGVRFKSGFLCMCEFYFIFLTPNTCIKVSNYLLVFSFYFCKSLNLIFNIIIFMVVVGFQPWTGWWFSWNDIVGIYLPNIYLSWQYRSVLYWNLGVRCNSGMQHYIC